MSILTKTGLRAKIRGSRAARALEAALLLLLDAVPRPDNSTGEQAITDAGAANLTSYHTKWTTTGAAAGTLAAGAFIGQRKRITLVSDLGDLTLTVSPGLESGDNTVTFADVGDTWEGEWNGDNWDTLMTVNVASGDAGPAISTV